MEHSLEQRSFLVSFAKLDVEGLDLLFGRQRRR